MMPITQERDNREMLKTMSHMKGGEKEDSFLTTPGAELVPGNGPTLTIRERVENLLLNEYGYATGSIVDKITRILKEGTNE